VSYSWCEGGTTKLQAQIATDAPIEIARVEIEYRWDGKTPTEHTAGAVKHQLSCCEDMSRKTTRQDFIPALLFFCHIARLSIRDGAGPTS
jgi:hypothetical protein